MGGWDAINLSKTKVLVRNHNRYTNGPPKGDTVHVYLIGPNPEDVVLPHSAGLDRMCGGLGRRGMTSCVAIGLLQDGREG